MHTRNYSNETARIIDEEVGRILSEQLDRYQMVLEEHRKNLKLMSRALLEHETIDGEEVARLVRLTAEGINITTVETHAADEAKIHDATPVLANGQARPNKTKTQPGQPSQPSQPTPTTGQPTWPN